MMLHVLKIALNKLSSVIKNQSLQPLKKKGKKDQVVI